MLASIQFDDEFPAGSAEVNNVIADGVLRSKVDIAHTVRSQMCMEFALNGSHIPAQFFCALENFGCGAFMHLDPLPALPQMKNAFGGGVKCRVGYEF